MAALYLAVTVAIVCCVGGAQAHQVRGSARAAVSVRKPLTDLRTYRYETFDNGLKVLAIEDPKAAKAGFANAVEAGSFYDPPQLPGLAHFCEHLLFLGTKKYPDEASFDQFSSQNDGSSNAYTEEERTVFYNEVSKAALDEGLDRFAQFFIEPLFKDELVPRELQAVNSEHEKNKPDQGRRLWELMRETARKDSVVSKFYTGTVESLGHGNKSTVDALKKYHTDNYCATRMSLVVTANMTTAALMEMAHKHFDAVPRGKCSPKPTDFGNDHPFSDPKQLGQFIEMQTDSSPQLWMLFPMPPTQKDYKAQPGSVLQYALTYAGPKSLKSRLKQKDLVNDLSIQLDQSSASTNLFVVFDLTPKSQKQEGLVELTGTVFDYLDQLRAKAKHDVEEIYPTMQQMSHVTFDYQEAPDSVMDTVSALAASMSSYAPEDILAGDTVVDKPDHDLVKSLIEMLKPSNVNMALASHGFDGKRANKYERWYDVHYAQNPIPEVFQKRWAKPQVDDGLATPPKLMYVPSDLTVLSATAGDIPKRLEGSQAEVWWLGKGLFSLPKAQIRAKLTVPEELAGSAKNSALKRLHAAVANLVLEQPMEDLGNCGLNWAIKDASSGYILEFDGYSQHLDSLVEQVTEGFAQPKFTSAQFVQTKTKAIEDLKDTTRNMPYEHALEALSAVTTHGVFGREDELEAAESTTEQELRDYIAKVHKNMRVQFVTTGNVDERRANSLADSFVQKMGVEKVLPASAVMHVQALNVQKGKPIEVRVANPIPHDANNAVINSYQYGIPDVSERVKLLMLGQMISEPVYNTLRTQEQLGYVVFGQMMQHLNVLELRVIVQGTKKDPDTIDTRIESVLDDFHKSLKKLSPDEFGKWKQSLHSALKDEDKNMGQEADRLFSQIVTDGLCFNRKKLALQYLETLNSPEEVAREFDQFREQPKKVSVRMFGIDSMKLMDPSKNSTSSLLQQTGSKAVTGLTVMSDSSKDKAVVEKSLAFYPTQDICTIAGAPQKAAVAPAKFF